MAARKMAKSLVDAGRSASVGAHVRMSGAE